MPRVFFDTNTLLYLISDDRAKADEIERLLFSRGIVSVQVLNEFAHVARRKHGLSIPQIRVVLDALRDAVDVVNLLIEIHEAGLTLADRYGFSTYDAMIVAAALDADCTTLYSEDMHSGLTVEGRLRIVNPFAS